MKYLNYSSTQSQILSFFFLLPFYFLLLISCEKSTTDPPPPTGPDTTSHSYEWQIDTLEAPDALQISMRGIWGSDENNVWVVGHSDVTKYQVWQWDGQNWENHHLLFPGHPHSLSAIYGFSEDDIWVVGEDIQNYPNTEFRSFIVHYNGLDWELIEDIQAPFCLSVWGISSSNLFVGSDSGLILNYDGQNWKKQSTNTESRILSIWGFSNNEIYAMGAHHDKVQPFDTTFYYFYRYDGQKWHTLQSALDYPFGPTLPFGSHLWGNKKLYSIGSDGLYEFLNEKWQRTGDFEALRAIHGTSENNIFMGGNNSQLFHFNGRDWFKFREFNGGSYKDFITIFTFENSVFVSSPTSNATHIYKGYKMN